MFRGITLSESDAFTAHRHILSEYQDYDISEY